MGKRERERHGREAEGGTGAESNWPRADVPDPPEACCPRGSASARVCIIPLPPVFPRCACGTWRRAGVNHPPPPGIPQVCVWDLETGGLSFHFRNCHAGKMTCMSFDGAGRRLLTGGNDGS
eukprot:scaffold6117_cov118-Isochrysis_galbana.AAC.5